MAAIPDASDGSAARVVVTSLEATILSVMLSHANPAVPARQAMGFALRHWPRAANLQTASSKEILMNYTDIFLADLEREAPISRRVLERVPDGKFDWKPAESSMPM